MSNDAYRKKFPKGSDWKESDGNDHGVTIIGYTKRYKFLGEQYIEELEDKIKELETELYFYNRNKRVEEIVDERTKVETSKINM